MGNIKVLVRDLESVNFDKLVACALEITKVLGLDIDSVEFVRTGDSDLDIEGDLADREYWKRGGRSMTELLAIRHGLGKPGLDGVTLVESKVAGLVALCQSLAQNHGKVAGKGGGQLYQKGTIPMIARNLSMLPKRAPAIMKHVVASISKALDSKSPIAVLIEDVALDEGGIWGSINKELAAAEFAVYDEANRIANQLVQDDCEDGMSFPLAKAPQGDPAPVGIVVKTTNPNLMKHLWASLKSFEGTLSVVVAIAVNPDTGRLAVLTLQKAPLDIRPLAKALSERFPGAEFETNLDRNSLVWDPRFSEKPGPDGAAMVEIVAEHLSFRKSAPAQTSSFKMTLGDRIKSGR